MEIEAPASSLFRGPRRLLSARGTHSLLTDSDTVTGSPRLFSPRGTHSLLTDSDTVKGSPRLFSPRGTHTLLTDSDTVTGSAFQDEHFRLMSAAAQLARADTAPALPFAELGASPQAPDGEQGGAELAAPAGTLWHKRRGGGARKQGEGPRISVRMSARDRARSADVAFLSADVEASHVALQLLRQSVLGSVQGSPRSRRAPRALQCAPAESPSQ